MFASAVFLLVAANPLPASPLVAKQAVAPNQLDKVICHQFTETGSLVSSRKICKTRRDWNREHDEVRASAGPGIDSCRNSGAGGPC